MSDHNNAMDSWVYSPQRPIVHRDGALQCPRCKQPWLHPLYSAVHDRVNNDAVCATVDCSGRIIEPINRNPSDARQTIAVGFCCEICDRADLELLLIQHKGITYAAWRYVQDAPPLPRPSDNFF
jgi:hypothetical protein